MTSRRAPDEFEVAMLAALPKVRKMALGLTKTADGADDLVQDVVEKALRYRDSFRLGTNMAAWLCFIGRNVFLNGLRRSWRSQELTDVMVATLGVDAHPVHRLELKETLQVLDYLEPEQAEAVLLAADGLTIEEMAAELGIAEGTVKSRVSRAREALRIYFAA